jgi:hypothetical protein
VLAFDDKYHVLLGSKPLWGLPAANRFAKLKEWERAETILSRLARVRPSSEVYQAWANLSLAMGDFIGARSRGQRAVELSGVRQRLSPWWQSFEKELNKRETPEKQPQGIVVP